MPNVPLSFVKELLLVTVTALGQGKKIWNFGGTWERSTHLGESDRRAQFTTMQPLGLQGMGSTVQMDLSS